MSTAAVPFTKNPRINKWLDMLDRAGWTAIQAAAGSLIAYLATDDFTWEQALAVTGTATAVAVLKVLIGQRTGTDESGALIGQPVIEPAPTNEPTGTTLAK
jgi:hypothetical protein